MKKGILAIYDKEAEYACRFMEYLNQKPDFFLEAMVFTNMIHLKDYLDENSVELLLLGEGIDIDGIPMEKVQSVGILTERSAAGDGKGFPLLYKFQSMEGLVKELSACCACLEKRGAQPAEPGFQPRGAEYIGVASPFGGSGKTLFSLALGQGLSEKEASEKGGRSEGRVLYVGLEPVASFREGDIRGTFSDALYWIRGRKGEALAGLSAITERRGGLDCLHSPDHYGDLSAISEEDMEFFLSQLSDNSSYEKVIFDIGFWSCGTISLLERMDRVYMPDFLNRAFLKKKENFLNIMKLEKREPLFQKIVPVALPFDRDIYEGSYHLDRLEKTQMGQFVCGLIKKDFQ